MASFIGFGFKTTVILSLAWAIAFLMRRRSAAARHVVWTAAFSALLVLPLLSVSLPPLRARLPGAIAAPNLTFRMAAAATALQPGPSAAARPRGNARLPGVGVQADWVALLEGLWAVGSAILLAQIAVGWMAASRLRREASPYRVNDVLANTEVLVTPRGTMPMSFGLLRPVVFLPAEADNWSDEQRRMVLLHEVAHVERGDLATSLLARTALSLCWWNPLAWTAWRAFLRERERAADDRVLKAGARASAYAAYLLEIARTLQSKQSLGWAAIAIARRSQLEGRLLAILDTRANRGTLGRAPVFAAILVAIVAAAPFAALVGQESTIPALPADVPAAIRAATTEKNYQLLENAAKAAAALRKYDVAGTLLQAALDIRRERFGQQSVQYGVGLAKLGDLERELGKKGNPETFYTRALAILGGHPESAPVYIHRGTAAIGRKEFDQAMEEFQRALAADPARAGTAKMWMAIVRDRQKNFDEADAMFREALAIEDPNSAGAATTMELYSLFLGRQGRADDAKSFKDRAVALRRSLGGSGAPAPRALSAGVYRIGNGVSAPSLLLKIEPDYTDEARAALLQGTVILWVEIGPDGLPRNIGVNQGLGLGLDGKAVDAIAQWRFKPGTKDGQPVAVAAQIEVNFRLM